MRAKDLHNNSVSKLYKGVWGLASHGSYRISSVIAASMPSSVSGCMRLPMICWISFRTRGYEEHHACRLVFVVSRPQLPVKMHLAGTLGVFHRLPDFRVKLALQVVGPRCASCFGNTPLAEASHFARRRIMYTLNGTRPNKTFHEASKPRSWLVH
jgi:hypothetical protein